jgi:hypothetical protein
MENSERELTVSGGGASLAHGVDKPSGKGLSVFDLATDPPGVNVWHVAPLPSRDGNPLPSEDSRNAALAALPRLVTHVHATQTGRGAKGATGRLIACAGVGVTPKPDPRPSWFALLLREASCFLDSPSHE